jgi:hypothetical protein
VTEVDVPSFTLDGERTQHVETHTHILRHNGHVVVILTAILTAMVTVEDVRGLALSLPRTTEHLIRDRIKFRVGSIVYLGFSRDETTMGFAFPKEERAALIAAEPGKFQLPRPSDERFNWIQVLPAAITEAEMRELVIEAWRMVVPKFLHAHPSTEVTSPERP